MTTSGVVGAGDACFVQAARRLLGVMARLCGWRPDEFWRATPEDAAAVLAGWLEPLAGPAADGGCDSGQLAAMMERFPDGGSGRHLDRFSQPDGCDPAGD